MTQSNNQIKINRLIAGSLLSEAADRILSSDNTDILLRFDVPFSDKNTLNGSYSSLLFYQDKSGQYVLAHLQGQHVQTSSSRTYNTRLAYEFSAEDFKKCEYNIYDIISALPRMEKYASKDAIPEINTIDVKKKSNKIIFPVEKKLLKALRYAIINKKQIFIQLSDEAKEWKENEIYKNKLSKAIFVAMSNLPLIDRKLISFLLSIDDKLSDFINSALLVAYRGKINIPSDSLTGTWDGSKLEGLDIDEKTIEEAKQNVAYMQELQRCNNLQTYLQLCNNFKSTISIHKIKEDIKTKYSPPNETAKLKNDLDFVIKNSELQFLQSAIVEKINKLSSSDRRKYFNNYSQQGIELEDLVFKNENEAFENYKNKSNADDYDALVRAVKVCLDNHLAQPDLSITEKLKIVNKWTKENYIFQPEDIEQLRQSKELGKDCYAQYRIVVEKYPAIKMVIENKINSDFSEINTYDELLNKLEKLKSDKNIDFLKEISGVQINVEQQESATKQSIKPILKYIKNYPLLKGAVSAKYLPVGSKQKVKNNVAENENPKHNFLWFVIPLAIIIAFVIGYWAGYENVLKLNMEKGKQPVEQPPKIKTDTTTPELQQEVVPTPTNDTLHLFGKIRNTDKVDISLQYTDKGLLIKPLFDKVTSNGFTIDSIKLQSGKKIVFPKIDGTVSRKLFAVFDSLNIAFPAAMEHTTNSLILYSKGISYKCSNDTAQLRVTDVLKLIPSTNTVDSVAIDGMSIKIDNAEFIKFNGEARTLNNFTYVLWLLNEIQKRDSMQTIKY